MNEEFDFKKVIDYIIKESAVKHIKDSFKRYGIEGTEQKIKEVYSKNIKLKEYMLDIYNKIRDKQL